MKTRTKLILMAICIAIIFASICVLTISQSAAYAETTEDPAEEQPTDTTVVVEKETILDEQTALDNFFNRYIVPIVGGTVGSVLMVFLAFGLPLIKKSGALKNLQFAYGNTKNSLSDATKKYEELKAKLDGIDVNKAIADAKAALSAELSPVLEKFMKEVDDIKALSEKVIAAARIAYTGVKGETDNGESSEI